MCVSAIVSYGMAALLLPLGLYGLKTVWRDQKPLWMLALMPVVFALQQGFEGGVWQAVNVGDDASVDAMALGFLFFSHFFWLLWVPLISSRFETDMLRKQLFLAMALIGGIGGLLVYVPLFCEPEWMSVAIVNHVVVYSVTTMVPGLLPDSGDRMIYAVIILVPLLFSSEHYLRTFGKLLAAALLVTVVIYDFALISVWCFFSAVLSLYIIYILRQLQLTRPAPI